MLSGLRASWHNAQYHQTALEAGLKEHFLGQARRQVAAKVKDWTRRVREPDGFAKRMMERAGGTWVAGMSGRRDVLPWTLSEAQFPVRILRSPRSTS